MAEEDALDLAEKDLARSERAGLAYPTPGERADAKLRLAEQYKLEQRQGQIGEAAAGSEGGGVLGAGRSTDHESIAAEIEAERQKLATPQSMARRNKNFAPSLMKQWAMFKLRTPATDG